MTAASELVRVFDFSDPHQSERVRRSLGMLQPQQLALKREEEIQLLEELVRLQDGLKTTVEMCQELLVSGT